MPFGPKVAIVTGASQGIGRETALQLSSIGTSVALASRNKEALTKVETEIRNRGSAAICIPTDVSNAVQVDKMIKQTTQQLGPVDLLINNAGVVIRRPITETEETMWDHIVNTNLKGTFLCTKAVLPTMMHRKFGRIVNVSSISGTTGTSQLSAYCASKWGIIGFTKATAEETRCYGVHVFAVCPGSVNTKMLSQGLPGAKPDMEPKSIADVIVYLATEAPTAMTGASIDVFG